MDSIFFALQLAGVLVLMVWAMRNDQAGDADVQQGLLALRHGDPNDAAKLEPGSEPKGRHRATRDRAGRHRRRSSLDRERQRRHRSSLDRKGRILSQD